MVTSNRHNPRIDEQLAHESRSLLDGAPVDARADEQRRQSSGPRPGQASADAQPPGREHGTSEGLAPIDIDRRAELATYLDGTAFPGDRDEVVSSAQQHHAPPDIIDLLEELPDDRVYERFEEVWEGVQSLR